MQEILNAYNMDAANCVVTPFGSGLINATWKVSSDKPYILQRVNDTVFKKPIAIAQNIRLLGDYLAQHYPEYRFINSIKTRDDQDLIFVQGQGWFRIFPFVPDSHSIDVVHSPGQAYEAARQFGKFT